MPESTDQPPEQPTPRACTTCNGDGGHTTATSGVSGAIITGWRRCADCRGTGVQGGGI